MIRDNTQAVRALEEFNCGHVAVEVASQRGDANVRWRHEHVTILGSYNPHDGWEIGRNIVVADDRACRMSAANSIILQRRSRICYWRRHQTEQHSFQSFH